MLLRLVVEVDEVVGLVDEVDVELVEALVDDVLVETLVDEVDVVEVVGLVDDEEVDVLVLAVLLLEEAALLKSYTLSRLGPPHISLELPLHSIVHPLSVAIIAPFEIVLPQ